MRHDGVGLRGKRAHDGGFGMKAGKTGYFSRVIKNPGLQAGVAAVLLAVCVAPCQADKLVLTNGKTIDGAIKSQSATQYVVTTKVGSITIDKADVVRLISDFMTPEELTGDKAVQAADYEAASSAYNSALAKIPTSSEAATRVRGKLARIQSLKIAASSTRLTQMYAQAQQLIQGRDFDPALQLLSNLASQLPASDPMTSTVRQQMALAHYAKAMQARDAVKNDVARAELEQSIDSDPSYYPAYLALGEILLANSATVKEGVATIEKGLTAGGDQVPEQTRYKYRYLLADRYYSIGDYENATANFAEVIPARDRYPAFKDALNRTVASYVKMGEQNVSSDFHKTVDNLTDALRLNPEYKPALFLLGRIYSDSGNTENAILTLQKLVDLDPRYPDAQLYLGKSFLDAHDYESAEPHLTQALDLDPKSYDALVDRAELYVDQAQYEKAAADLEAAKKSNPDRWQAYYLSGKSALKQAKYDEAQTDLMDALKKNQNNYEARLAMGRVLVGRGAPDQARQWFEQVANSIPDGTKVSLKFRRFRAEAFTELGNIDLNQNTPRQAQTQYEAALKSIDNYGPALNKIGDVKKQLGNESAIDSERQGLFQEAEKYYRMAIDADPKNPDFYLSLAVLYHNSMKNSAKALAAYNKYVDNGGRDPQVNGWIAELGGTARPELTAAETSATLAAMTNTTVTSMTQVNVPMYGGTSVTLSTGMTTAPAAMTSGTAMGVPAPAGVAAFPGAPVPAPAPAPGAVPALPVIPTSVMPTGPGVPALPPAPAK